MDILIPLNKCLIPLTLHDAFLNVHHYLSYAWNPRADWHAVMIVQVLIRGCSAESGVLLMEFGYFG